MWLTGKCSCFWNLLGLLRSHGNSVPFIYCKSWKTLFSHFLKWVVVIPAAWGVSVGLDKESDKYGWVLCFRFRELRFKQLWIFFFLWNWLNFRLVKLLHFSSVCTCIDTFMNMSKESLCVCMCITKIFYLFFHRMTNVTNPFSLR